MGTVERAFTANNKSNVERSTWTRSWSHGRSAGRRCHWKNQGSVHSSGCTRRETMLSEWNGTQKGHTFTLNQHGSFLTQPNGSSKWTMSREGNKDTLKVVCMLTSRDAQSVTSLILTRELEIGDVNCETSRLVSMRTREKTNSTEDLTMDEKIAHERIGHATCDPRCETCLEVR